MAEVAIYVQAAGYAKASYKKECYAVRMFPGIEMVRDELERVGISVEYCSSATVHRYKVVLVSIISACDWPSFISERVTWKGFSGKVVIGGTGVLNINPFLDYGDYFWFGRADGDVAAFVSELLVGNPKRRAHVADSSTFDPDGKYEIRQSYPYKHDYSIPGGLNDKYSSSQINEAVIGCQRNCLFCSYGWHRKHSGDGLQKDSGVLRGDRERTIFEVLAGNHDNLNSLRMVGLDGISERIRRAVAKPITHNDVVNFMALMSQKSTPHHIKFYNICGFWIEQESDYKEFADTLTECDKSMDRGKFCIELHSTPFRPMPATPMACCPTKQVNYRGGIAKVLRRYTGKVSSNSVFFDGDKLFALETMGTEALSTLMIDMIVLRGEAADAERLRKLSTSKKYAGASSADKEATIRSNFDIDKLFGWYDPDMLPTRYLSTYRNIDFAKWNSIFRKL